MVIEWDVPITMDDGLVLRADVFAPAGPGQHPVILSYGPYAKGLAFQEGYADQWRLMVAAHPDVARGSSNRYANWETVDPEKWVPDGYACVRVDSRGAGRSPGFLDPFSPREARDLYECVEWAAAQPWSTGKVGINGISYYAMNAWHVAGLQPPHLAAICVWEGAADLYRDATHHGGILSTFFQNWYDKQVIVVQHGAAGPRSAVTGEPVAGPEARSEAALESARTRFGELIAAHPLDGEFWRARSADWDKITVPLLTAANWGGQGLHTRGNFEGFTRAASAHKWLEVHGLEHWTHFYTTTASACRNGSSPASCTVTTPGGGISPLFSCRSAPSTVLFNVPNESGRWPGPAGRGCICGRTGTGWTRRRLTPPAPCRTGRTPPG